MAGRPINRWHSRALGACGALLVHALMLQAVSLGASAPKHRPEHDTGPGASALLAGADATMTLVLVQLPGVMQTDALEQLASRGTAAANAAIEVLSPDPAPALEIQEAAQTDPSSEAPQAIGDPAMRSMLFGRYTGQINARIERAWTRPRSAVTEGDPHFRCTARITQDAHGNVKELELTQCNGSIAWQQSLVAAVQRASPLPAPPNPAVFTNVLTLTFDAREYMPGSPDQGYEPAPLRLPQVAASTPIVNTTELQPDNNEPSTL